MATFSTAFEAIGVRNEVVVDSPRALAPADAIARSELGALDRACSRFRDDSELALVNRRSGSEVPVGPLFLTVVEQALHAAAATGGLVDPTVGHALDGLGYDRDFRLVRGFSPRSLRLAPAAGWQRVRIDRRAGTIRIPRGAALDLGAVAKAHAADHVARRIRAETGAEVLVSFGGDVAVAGSPPRGWPVLVTDDHRADDAVGQLVGISGGGLATSSTVVRRWRVAGRDWHHVVDPVTGLSATEHWRTVSVAAATCVDANAAATASIVLGASAPRWLERLGLAARLVRGDGSVTVTAGWPRDAA